ncbi:MAG: class I SAM-dependent methyltransferase [Cyanobacteria bacterium M_DeepCast_100m_m1_067]|nr:class I SAM-dependent methyltransferase [Cyanobacteria bacterium M_DeepCast_100m_m1_067]
MDFFSQQWATYRAVVSHDLMEHRAVAQATANALEGWLAQRSASAPPPEMVDLGCGDLALLAPVLRRLPLGSYTGLDLTAAVLPLAEKALSPMPYPCTWQEGNLLAWSQSEGPPVAILHSAFAIHHLSDAEKTTFLRGARQRITADGLLLWADVFREPGEGLTAEQQSQVIDHLSSFDIPAERGAMETLAAAAGWHWRWAWQGQHQAEALAVLTPA